MTARTWLRWLATPLIIPPILSASLSAADPVVGPAPPPAGVTAPAFTLRDCLAIARENQPSLKAAVSSLAAARAAHRGLNELKFGQIIAKDLPVRRQQAALGVTAATANLAQVERDVECSVARMYFSIIFAKEQTKVAQSVVNRLKATIAVGETLLGKDGAPTDLDQISIDRAKLFLKMADTKLDDARRGLGRASAGLREAMGLAPEVLFFLAEGTLPEPLPGVDRDTIVRMAVSLRGEVAQASSAHCISVLEIDAQSRSRLPKRPSAAAGGDFHSRPIPTGSFGDDYKPGAIGIEFPTLFVGPRSTRMDRARDLADRAGSVADKAKNLVALDAEDAYLRWEESFSKIAKLKSAPAEADTLAEKTKTALDAGSVKSYRDVVEIQVIASQLRAQYNEALYQHAVALTELERATAGGFAAGVTVAPAK